MAARLLIVACADDAFDGDGLVESLAHALVLRRAWLLRMHDQGVDRRGRPGDQRAAGALHLAACVGNQ